MKDSIEFEMVADEKFYKGLYAESLAIAEAGLKLYKNNHSLLMTKGKTLLAMGNAVEALSIFEERIEKYGQNAAYPHLYRAACQALLKNEAEMISSLSTAFKSDRKIGATALKISAFAQHKSQPFFLASIGLGPEMPLSAEIATIREFRNSGQYVAALQLAIKCLDTTTDSKSLLDSLIDIIEYILEDIDEHGNVHFLDLTVSIEDLVSLLEKVRIQRDDLGPEKSAYINNQERDGKYR